MESNALQVNLRRTDVEVVIPTDQQVLLEITAPYYGIRQETERLLREVNHRYVNWEDSLEALHSRAMSDFFRYNNHDRGPEGIAVLCSIYSKIADLASPNTGRNAVRKWLAYLTKIARESGEQLPRNLLQLHRSMVEVGGALGRAPDLQIVASPGLKQLVKALIPQVPQVGSAAEALEQVCDLLTATLDSCYARWLRRPDPVGWYMELPPADGFVLEPPTLQGLIAPEHLADCRKELERLTSHADLQMRGAGLLGMPDDTQIARGYVEVGEYLGSTGDALSSRPRAVRWLLWVLGHEALGSVHESAIHAIGRSYVELMGNRQGAEGVVRETFAALRRANLVRGQTVLELVDTIGREVVESGTPGLADVLVEEILACDFQYPKFSGYTEEWGVRSNPSHVKNIRTYLSLIEHNPRLLKQLLAGLVVNLGLGGVVVRDTDLFQKDITGLLSSNVGPVYHLVKQLLRLMPVYFNDIGAEGELRDATTRIDEISGRRDLLCHFLRKQCHVESNPLLVPFVDAIMLFWATGDRTPLRGYVPSKLYGQLDIQDDLYRDLHRVFSALVRSQSDIGTCAELEPTELRWRMEQIPDVGRPTVEKAETMLLLRRLLTRKYEVGHEDLLDRLRRFHHLEPGRVDLLEQALSTKDNEGALEILLGILEDLKRIVLSQEKTLAVEHIYHKRHIAVGIPSVYGHYREPRFEAMGLTLRIESLASVLFEQLLAGHNPSAITRATLFRIVRWLRLLLRAIRIDGCHGKELEAGVAMLEQVLGIPGATVGQYTNIFQFLSHGIKHLISQRFISVYEPILERLVNRMLEIGVLGSQKGDESRETLGLQISERFLRDLVAGSFGPQLLDRLVGSILHSLAAAPRNLASGSQKTATRCDVDRCFVPIELEDGPQDGVVHLGYKGYNIKRLAGYGFQVPPGVIITTEMFRCGDVFALGAIGREVMERVRQEVRRLERISGARFGDPKNPLLLSVRSGAAISMPGMLDTMLNVGMNADIAAGLARASGSPWAAWDCYRRFLQLWGMSHGVQRDVFDELVREAKQRFSASSKVLLPPEKMRDLALRYRSMLTTLDVEVVDDPFEQLLACIQLAIRSWDSKKARVYRREMQIADEWGTAVILQKMVFGNLNPRCGTGVVLSRHPKVDSHTVRLYGDFIVQGQGDDVVSGLVQTYPITEFQRQLEAKEAPISLETAFPGIFSALSAYVEALIHDHGLLHQELEFTFEGDKAEDLYVLQSRDIVYSKRAAVETFVPSEALERAKTARGIGVGGGALCGRAAHTAADIAMLRQRYPKDRIIMMRPDTVPEDIQLVLEVDGLLTATGGATSHAALVAQRLGRTCVVGCRALHVDDLDGRSELAERLIRTGDFVSINGMDGSIYLGKHPVTTARVEGL